MKLRYAVILVSVFSLLLPGIIWAVDDCFVVEIHVAKKAILPTDPIEVQWMVRNLGNNTLPLWIQSPPQPAVTYRLWLKSISDDSVDLTTFGPLGTSAFSEVPPHSHVSIWTLELRRIFGGYTAELAPGLYRVSVDGSWTRVGGTVTRYWAEAFFAVEAQDTGTVLRAIGDVNTNIAYTQQKIETNRQEILRNRTAYLSPIYMYIRGIYNYVVNTYYYVLRIYDILT